MNSVVIAVSLMMLLSLFRINVVISLTVSSLVAGLLGGMDLKATVDAFNNGLGGGAEIALSYALLGAFAVALSHSGLADWLSQSIIKKLGKTPDNNNVKIVKWSMLIAVLAMAISSQNILPIHIAFIPIMIPPLLGLMNKFKLDRRLIACILTFGLVTTYMILPIGFGGIFLDSILLANLNNNGLSVVKGQVPSAMLIPAIGMIVGLLIAVFISYRKPREYQVQDTETSEIQTMNKADLVIAVLAIASMLSVQLYTGSMIFGALIGFIVFSFSGAIRNVNDQDIFNQGVRMMAAIGFIMISASGFAAVIKQTGEVASLVTSIEALIGNSKALAAFLMLIVGLFITMGIGSSFSTVPIIAAIYVPLAIQFGFSPAATIALVGTAGALGDAGSPASDSTLGPTAGLNADGQHDHMRDSVIPTFIHYNIPLLVFGWVAAMTL
ncbi:TRAP transporter large permease subunit [Parashewanella curva]|uniref:TRAP transporter large permease subunit n=1 Tax=Parashewanella curva TaxID=2338552 RepID=A0A3L8PVJ1_9GAMM|nr:Na+/H+ antiporter family protein [Parashewanella curva]RLV58082.1 TRAP transporter large permease subunit [Parashewanella curva]